MAITRRFQLEPVKNRVVVEQHYKHITDPDTGERKRIVETVERIIEEGWFVYFVGGQSIFVESREQLARLGLLPHLNADIDTETGEVVPDAPRDLKAIALRKAANASGAIR